MITRRRLLELSSAAALGGCASSSRRDQLTILTLKAPRSEGFKGTVASWQLLVDEPVADPLLREARIVRAGRDGTGVYRGITWNDTAPRLLQTLIVRAFENSGQLPAVARPTAGLRGDLLLLSELQSFEVDAERAAVVKLQVKLVQNSDQALLDSRLFAAEASLSGSGPSAVAAAFQQALDQLLPELVGWTVAAGDRQRTR